MFAGRGCVRCLLLLAVAMMIHSSPTSSRSDSSKTALTEKKQRSSSRIGPNAQPHRRSDTDSVTKQASNFLHKYGFFRQEGEVLNLQLGPPGSGAVADRPERSPDPMSEAIRMFQSYFGLQETGTLDEETVQLMKKDRCGVADIPDEIKTSSDRHSPSDFAVSGSKWEQDQLTWKLDKHTSQLQRGDQRRTIIDAFNTWRNVAPLEFREVGGQSEADINIQFGARDHGDSYPFDGHGMVLAHAFGPGSYDLAGDMHLDDDEKWTVGQQEGGSDLLLVAIHELGHSLGLSHSRDPDAIMYPYYGFSGQLGQDDIRGIQSLYGARIGQPNTTPRPRPKPTTTTRRTPVTRFPYTRSATFTKRPPSERTTPPTPALHFDVVFQDNTDKEIYTGIVGGDVYQFNTKGMISSHPAPLNTVYPRAPSHPDAVFTIPETTATYFIKDNRVWRYQNFQLDSPEYPKDLEPSHFPETIRYILPVVSSGGQRRIFVFGKTQWLEYNFDNPPRKSNRPRTYVIPQYWPSVPTDVSYATMGPDNYIYFISPDSHVVLDGFRRVMHGGKQAGQPQWIQPAYAALSSGASHLHSFGPASIMAALAVFFFVFRKI